MLLVRYPPGVNTFVLNATQLTERLAPYFLGVGARKVSRSVHVDFLQTLHRAPCSCRYRVSLVNRATIQYLRVWLLVPFIRRKTRVIFPQRCEKLLATILYEVFLIRKPPKSDPISIVQLLLGSNIAFHSSPDLDLKSQSHTPPGTAAYHLNSLQSNRSEKYIPQENTPSSCTLQPQIPCPVPIFNSAESSFAPASTSQLSIN